MSSTDTAIRPRLRTSTIRTGSSKPWLRMTSQSLAVGCRGPEMRTVPPAIRFNAPCRRRSRTRLPESTNVAACHTSEASARSTPRIATTSVTISRLEVSFAMPLIIAPRQDAMTQRFKAQRRRSIAFASTIYFALDHLIPGDLGLRGRDLELLDLAVDLLIARQQRRWPARGVPRVSRVGGHPPRSRAAYFAPAAEGGANGGPPRPAEGGDRPVCPPRRSAHRQPS